MKKLLEKGTYITLLLLVTIASYGQTYQNPTFGTVTTKTAPTTTADPYVSSINANGVIGKVAPENIPVNVIPPTTHYTPVTPNLKGHLQGIDNAIGNIPLTTAGNTTRVWFTGDATTITAGTFYLTNATNKGTVANVSQSVINDDNQKKYFTQDLIGQPFATATLFPPGVYAGNLSASTTPNSAQQRFTVELYKCNNAGTPIASGVSGAPVGDLGVTVILILDSGLLTLADGSVTNVPVSASLASQFSIAVGERIRYHVSAEKVGTASSNITESVWYGSSFNSFLDVPTPITSSGVSNVSTVTGATVTNALDNLNVGKANDTDVVHKTGNLAEIANGNKNFTGTTRFGNASGGNQLLWQLPGLNDMLYKEVGGLDYDFNVGPNNPNSFIWKNNEGIVHQAFYFGDGSATTNIWGVSASEDSGITWQNSITANSGGKIGINNNNPRYNLDTYGVNRTRGVVSSDTEISISPTSWDITYTSPDLALTLEQGYTSDGVYNYQFGTSRIAKYNFDYSVLVTDNTTPFSSIPGVDHIGDGCYLNGFIYAPVDNQSLTPIVTNEKIAVYNATTLAFVTTYDISAQNVEGASICTDGNILYLFSYYSDGTKIWKYSTTGTFLGTITVATPVTFVQGASYYKGLFYVSDQENLYTITLDGLTTKQIKVAPNAPLTHRAQGLEVVNGEVRWTVLKTGSTAYNTYFLNPFIGAAPSFKADSSGKVQASAIGIGVTPSSGLHVKGTDSASSKITMERTSGAVGRYTMGIQNGDNQFGINDDAQGDLTRFVISKDGNIGMGYFTPTDPILTGNRLSVNGKGYFNGTVRVSNGVATTDAVNKSQLDLKADINSQTLTGDPKAPTPTAGDNDTSIATTAFVNNAVTSGTYTPTLANVTNVTGLTLQKASYTKIGNIITVNTSFSFNITSASVNSQFTITLPINRASASSFNMGSGSVVSSNTPNNLYPCVLTSGSTSNVTVYFVPTATASSYSGSVSFQYLTTD